MPTKTRLRLALTATVSVLALVGFAIAPAPAAVADPETYTITGTVYLGDTSHPAGTADATVTLAISGGAEVGTAPVADDGSYLFEGLAYDSYTVTANYIGTGDYLAARTVTVAEGVADITLLAAFTISGHVSIDTDSRPATEGEVRVVAESAFTASSAETDSAGDYTLEVPAGAPYSLRFEYQDATKNYPVWYSLGDAGPGSRTDPGATITLTGDLEGVDVVIGAGAAIVGTLRDSAGAPVAQENVRAVSRDGAGALTQDFQTTTDSEGNYYLRSLPDEYLYSVSFAEGSSRYAVQTPGGDGVFGTGDPIDVSDGLTHTVDATLYAPATLSGTVASTEIYVGAGLELQAQLWFYDSTDTWRQVDTVNVDNSYSFGSGYGGLPPGYYRVTVGYLDSVFYTFKASPVLTVDEGEDATWNTSLLYTARTSATAFVASAYDDVLDRIPSTRESDYWVNLLLAGYPRAGVAGGFNNSDEYRLIKIEEAYNQVLGRDSESSGAQYWLGMMRAGVVQPDDVHRIFLSSDEFYDNQGEGTPAGYVRALYLDQTGREPDSRGLAYWTALLEESGRGIVVDGLWFSQESYETRVSEAYRDLLGRSPEGSGRAYWVGVARAYGLTSMRTLIMASDEYWDLAQVLH